MNYGKTWGWITPPCLFQCPKIILSFFLLLSFSQVVGSLYQKCDVSSFLWVWEHPRSKVNKCYFVLSSSPFMLISFCINFPHVPFILYLFPFICLSCSFHVLFIWHSCPFIFRRYLSNMQAFERWDVQTGQVGIRPNACVFIIFRYRFCYRVAIVLEACAGCHLQGSWTCTCISSLSFYTLIVFWAGKALVVLRGKPS